MADTQDPGQSGAAGGGPAPTTDPVNGSASSSASTASQLALGNNQWIQLRVKMADLVRVGTDTNRTLANVNSFEAIFTATVPSTALALNVAIDAAYLTGGFGPDVGDVGTPYVYCERFRSSITGEVSNVGPPSEGGVSPRRQRVLVTPGAASGDAQADLIDKFRIGGTLDRYTYIGSGPNSTAVYNDDVADENVSGSITPPFDDFQPWPTLDIRRTGACTVAGPALLRTSGDTFNTSWAPGTIVIVNGRAGTIKRVLSTTVLHLNENVGTGTALTFEIPAAEIQGQPLPAIWGPDNDGVFYACGDASNPGTLYWSKPGSPDVTSDQFSLIVTSGSEILQHGFIWDGQPFVASTEQVYRIDGDPVTKRTFLTACGKGFWARWFFCVTPSGVFFGEKEGISVTVGGGAAQSLTEQDLRYLFPHDGVPGVDVNGIQAPDYAQPARLRLNAVNRRLYFDYASQDGSDRTLVLSIPDLCWQYDLYDSGIWTRLAEPGAGVDDQVLGSAEGRLSSPSGATDHGDGIDWAWYTRWENFAEDRAQKLFGDAVVDVAPNGNALTVTPVYDSGPTLTPLVLTNTSPNRQLLIAELNNGVGVLANNLGLRIAGTTDDVNPVPVFYAWEPTAVPKTDTTRRRATDWDDLGMAGAKFVQGVLIRANTFGSTKSVEVQYDGGTVALTLSINHDGEQTKAYPLSADGWTPFTAHMVRLVGADDTPWQLYEDRTIWVFEPSPELATEWTTQPTTHDLPGYLSVRDMVVAYLATDPVVLTVYYDGAPVVYPLPATSGAYARTYVPLRAGKGRAVQYSWTSDAPFSLFKRDCAVRVQGWGIPGGYQTLNPFGGPSRADGAAI